MDTKAHASSSSSSPFPSSSSRHASPTFPAMSTPKTARPRIPLGELPISSFLSAANASASSPSSTTGVSPILKPVAMRHFAASPTRVERSTATAATSTPHTPPHHETHPVNVRPHHAHVATGLGLDSPNLHRPAALPASPTTCVAPATPPPSLLKRQHQSTSSSSSPAPIAQPTAASSASPQQQASATQSLPRRKRDRVDDATEHVLARERGQDPVWTSPSPHKNAAIAATAAAAAAGTTSGSARRYSAHAAHVHHHHRRMSSTGSAKAFALSPRFAAAKSLAPVAGGSALDDDEEEEEEEDELRQKEDMVVVKPLRINSPSTSTSMGPPSSKSATPPRSTAAAAPALGEDVFGVTTSSPSGGLVVFCDDEASAVPAFAAGGKGSADRYAGEDGANRENDVSLLDMFLGRETTSTTAGASKKNGKSKSKSPSLGMGGSSSPGPSALSPMKRKKGTGGRLSLVATGEAGQVAEEEEEDDENEAEEGEEASS